MAGTRKRAHEESERQDETKQYIANVLSHLPKESVLQSFAERFLHSMTLRVLQTFSYPDLVKFIQARFDFFNEANMKHGAFRVENQKRSNNTIIEVAYPDAAHLVITLESLFKELDIRVRFKIHALISLELNEVGQLAMVGEPVPFEERVVLIYFETEEIENETALQELQQKLESHLYAVKLASRDREQIVRTMMELKKPMAAVPEKDLLEPMEEWQTLLDWLENFNFSFFGYVAFLADPSQQERVPLPESGLGILADEYKSKDASHLLETLTATSWKLRNRESPFVFDTIKVISPVKRFENLMRLSLKIPNEAGILIEHVVVGLIKRSSLQTKSSEVPIIHYKMMYIFEEKHLLFDSHDYNQVIRIFSTVPQFELFRTPASNLLQMANNIMSIADPNEIYCFIQDELQRDQILLIIAIPSELFIRENIEKIVDYLKDQAPYTDSEVVEIRGTNTCRIHVYFDLLGDGWEPDPSTIEEEIGELIKSWEERVRQALYEQYPSGLSDQLFKRYIPMMPIHYQVRSQPKDVVRDILVLESMSHGKGMEFNLVDFQLEKSDLSGSVSLLYVYSQDKVDLIHIMPVLQNLGLYVVDQLTVRIGDEEKTKGYVQSYRVRDSNQKPLDTKRYRKLVVDLLGAIFDEKTENDPLNALSLLADLSWREINVLQMYRNLYLQTGSAYTREKINSALCHYAGQARALFEYFETRFSPEGQFGDLAYRNDVLLPNKEREFIDSLRRVEEVAEDVIFRHIFDLMRNSLRTNFFIPKPPAETMISVKLDSRNVEEMPVPVPFREIYVHDVGMEGTHLRFGTVARGGLRWSDRLDDFRTEILGLVKTQQTKNVVIVPVGSKGGFIIKKSGLSREEAAAESQKQYRKFISGLLDITDNMDSNRKARHPHHVLAYDPLDPYLVVAADKGTATFSDTANSISSSYRFWLDDAFASGGSVGYDHKKEGITARGGWECVKLHFQEKGKDIQTETTSVVGIGDMSGDVFGNGMLLSKALQLKAAFNHLHIFLDPNPDPAESWKERDRLFALPRSTWADYSSKLISPGGGVFERKAKEITLSPEIQEMLGVSESVMNGEKLIRAVLCMETELLWFGGIGTYIKSETETHFQVGDQANDAVRIDASECRAMVIGEGGNLGMTQLARIDFAHEKSLNTDAIDNSAGVNMSDYEVNIKILLQQMLEQKELKSQEERNDLLAQATEEVSTLVLANNRGQHRLLSMDYMRSKKQFRTFKHLVRHLITEQGLDDKSEAIPSRGQLELMEESGEPLPRPILAVLQAYVKMGVYDSLLESDLLDDPYLEGIYQGYFPATIRDRFGDKISKHPLRREIIGTLLTNKIVNRVGMNFFFRMGQLSGKSVDQMVMSYMIFDECLDGASFGRNILYKEAVDQETKYEAMIAFEGTLQLLTQSLLQLSGTPLSFDMLEKYKVLFAALFEALADSKEAEQVSQQWQSKGFSLEMSQTIARSTGLNIAPDVIYLHEKEGVSVSAAMKLIVQVNEVFAFQWLKQKVDSIELDTDWDQSHHDILLQSIEVHKLSLIRLLLQHHNGGSEEIELANDWLEPITRQFAVPLSTYFQTLNQLQSGSPITLTTVSVCINRLNFLDVN